MHQEPKTLPDLTIQKPIEKIRLYAELLLIAIQQDDKTLIHNNINLLRIALRDYDLERFGYSEELPF